MRKSALLLLSVISFASVVVGQTTVTVTANLQNTFGANVVANAQVCFSLIDGAGNPIADPRTSTGLLISTDLRCVTPNGSGTISTTLVPNNLIVPSGTQYLVAEYFQGTYVHGDNFTFNSNNPSYNLSTTAPNTPSNVTPVGFQAVLTNPIASQVISQPNGTTFTIQNAPLLLSDGTPAAPSYAFINNPGNGISNSGSNLIFNVGGATKAQVGTAGINLGTDVECYFLGALQDAGICRNAAGALSIGNGTPGDASGNLTLALIKNADGSAAAPSYTFGNATSSGWYHAGGGQPVYSISGTPAFTITGSRAQIGSGALFSWGNGTSAITTADTGLSRDSAGVVDVGNGTAGNKSGGLSLSTVTLNGSTSGSSTLSVSPTGGTLNLGSTNATVGPTGIITVAGCTGCGSGTFSGSEFGFNNAGSAGTSSLDTAFSRSGPGVFNVGNGTVGDRSGSLLAGQVEASTALKLDTTSAPLLFWGGVAFDTAISRDAAATVDVGTGAGDHSGTIRCTVGCSGVLSYQGPTTTLTGNFPSDVTVYSYTLPAGTMGSHSCLRITIWWTRTGSSTGLIYRAGLGSQAGIIPTNPDTSGTSSVSQLVCNNNSLTSQNEITFPLTFNNTLDSNQTMNTWSGNTGTNLTYSFVFNGANTETVKGQAMLVELLD